MTADVEAEYRRRLELPRGAGPVDRVALWDAVWCEIRPQPAEDGLSGVDMGMELPLVPWPFSRR